MTSTPSGCGAWPRRHALFDPDTAVPTRTTTKQLVASLLYYQYSTVLHTCNRQPPPPWAVSNIILDGAYYRSSRDLHGIFRLLAGLFQVGRLEGERRRPVR